MGAPAFYCWILDRCPATPLGYRHNRPDPLLPCLIIFFLRDQPPPPLKLMWWVMAVRHILRFFWFLLGGLERTFFWFPLPPYFPPVLKGSHPLTVRVLKRVTDSRYGAHCGLRVVAVSLYLSCLRSSVFGRARRLVLVRLKQVSQQGCGVLFDLF